MPTVCTPDGEFINADLMVWAAGIKAPDFMKEIGGLKPTALTNWWFSQRCKRRLTRIFMRSATAHPARVRKGGFVPPRARAAHQMATCALNNILAQMKDKPLKSYVYKDHGSLVRSPTTRPSGA